MSRLAIASQDTQKFQWKKHVYTHSFNHDKKKIKATTGIEVRFYFAASYANIAGYRENCSQIQYNPSKNPSAITYGQPNIGEPLDIIGGPTRT